MEAVMENPGLIHIGEIILKNMHFKTQAQCRLVKRSWNRILEKEASKTKTDLDNLVNSIKRYEISPDSKNISYEDLKEIPKKNERLCSWIDFVIGMSSKMNNPVINILLKKHISYELEVGFSFFPLEHFVLKKDIEMVDLILKQKLTAKKYDITYSPNVYFPKSDFDKALDIAVKNRYTEIAQSFKPYMTLRHHENYVFGCTEGDVTNFLKIMHPNPKEALIVDHFGENIIHTATSFGLGTRNGCTKTVKYRKLGIRSRP